MEIGAIIHKVKSCSSTNDLAKKMAVKGAGEGTVIIAKRQTKGRGTKGRTWYSAENKGLYASIILRPEEHSLSLIPLMAGLAVREAIFEATGIHIGLRWPNDLIWGECKLGGILCESGFKGDHPSYVILGIGLNLSHKKKEFPEAIRSISTSLKLITKKDVDREGFLQNLWKALNHWYQLFCRGQGLKIIRSFEEGSVFTKGQKIMLQSQKGHITGIYKGVDSQGGLVLEEGGKDKAYFSAEIKKLIYE